MEQFAPGDGERWKHAYDDWLDVSDKMLDTLFTPFPPVRAGLGLARQLRVGGALRLARRLVLSVRELGSEMFKGEGATLALAGCALHTDLSPEEAGGGVYGWLLAMLGQEYGWPVPVGGAQQITSALVDRFLVPRRPDHVRRARHARADRPGPGDGSAHRGRPELAGPACRAGRRAGPVAVPGPGRRPLAAAPLRRGPPVLPLGRRHGQGGLGAVREDPLEEPRGGRRRGPCTWVRTSTA